MKRIAIVIFVLISFFVAHRGVCFQEKEILERAGLNHVALDANGAGAPKRWRIGERNGVIFLSHGDLRVNVQTTSGIGRAEAEKLIATKITLLSNLYVSSPSPYSGHISKTVQCSLANLTKIDEVTVLGQRVKVFTGPTSSRDAFGVCSAIEAVKIGSYSGVYVPERETLFQFTLFKRRTTVDSDRRALTAFVTGFNLVPSESKEGARQKTRVDEK